MNKKETWILDMIKEAGEDILRIPFEERVNLARKQIKRAKPLLKRNGQENQVGKIVARFGLNTQEGHDALTKPLTDEIAKIERELQSR